MIVVDDQLLLSILTGQESESLLSARSNGVATTMCWFYRLSRAIAAGGTTGALSRRFSALSAAHQAEVIRLVDELPALLGVGRAGRTSARDRTQDDKVFAVS